MAITNIPTKEYLAFLDGMLKEFYNGDEKTYWRFGKQNAKYTLSEKGPFHAFFRRRREPTNFITNILHRVWAMNYDEGSVKYEIEGNITHAYVLDLPIYHIYFEYVVMGYAQKAIDLIGLTIKETIKVRSSAKEIHYKFVLDL